MWKGNHCTVLGTTFQLMSTTLRGKSSDISNITPYIQQAVGFRSLVCGWCNATLLAYSKSLINCLKLLINCVICRQYCTSQHQWTFPLCSLWYCIGKFSKSEWNRMADQCIVFHPITGGVVAWQMLCSQSNSDAPTDWTVLPDWIMSWKTGYFPQTKGWHYPPSDKIALWFNIAM